MGHGRLSKPVRGAVLTCHWHQENAFTCLILSTFTGLPGRADEAGRSPTCATQIVVLLESWRFHDIGLFWGSPVRTKFHRASSTLPLTRLVDDQEQSIRSSPAVGGRNPDSEGMARLCFGGAVHPGCARVESGQVVVQQNVTCSQGRCQHSSRLPAEDRMRSHKHGDN